MVNTFDKLSIDPKGVSILIPLYKEKKLPDPLVKTFKVIDYPRKSLEVIFIEIQCNVKRPEGFKTISIKSKKRIGYGEALNLGIKKAKYELLLISNPDTRLKQDTLQLLVDFMAGNSQIGIVGPKVYELDRPTRLSSYDIPGVGYNFLLGRVGRYTLNDLKKQKEPLAVDWVSGSIMLIRKTLWKKIKGFDEKYFLYWEDADFCMRAKLLGSKVFLLPQVVAYHQSSASVGRNNPEKIYYSIRNNRYFLYKYSSFLGKLLLHIESILFVIVKTFRIALNKKDLDSRIFLSAIIDFYKQSFLTDRAKKARVNLFF